MNIIFVEGIIQGMTIIKKKFNYASKYYRYGTLIIKRSKLLTDSIFLLIRETHTMSNEFINNGTYIG